MNHNYFWGDNDEGEGERNELELAATKSGGLMRVKSWVRQEIYTWTWLWQELDCHPTQKEPIRLTKPRSEPNPA